MTYRAMGVFGEVSLGTGAWCGSITGSQTALKALGFYTGDVDGIVGPKSQAAMASYALSKGIVYDPTNPSGPICVALAADYAAYSKGSSTPPSGAGTCPTGTVGFPPWCVGMPQQSPSTAQTGCPTGTIGVPGMCFPIPAGTFPMPTPPGIPPVSPQGVPNIPTAPLPGSQPSMPPPSMPPETPPPKPGLASMWAGLSTPGKIAVAGAGALLAVALLGAFAGKKKSPMTPNRRRRRRARRNLRGFMKRRYAKAGVMTVGRGRRRRRFGHLIPPKKYRRKGAVRKSQYAWPSGYAYPIYDKKHVRAALTRFSRYKRDYPPTVRRTIARSLNRAKRRFGIGGNRVKA